jgi:integrase
MTYAVRECGWISDNPCLRVAKFQESKGRDRIATPEECNRLLEACEKSRNKYLTLIVLLAITTGMRQSEILGMTWDCIDFDRQTITLKETKNGRPRIVSLVGQPLQMLREQYLKRSLYTQLVFPAKKRFGKISIRKAWD